MRLATLDDFPLVTHMIREYLLEQAREGSPVRVTRHTLEFYRDLARSYLTGSLSGAVVLASEDLPPAGFALGGEDPGLPRLDTDHGRTCVVWAIWVDPHCRQKTTALEMLRFGAAQMVRQGFQEVAMGVMETNTAGRALTESFGAHLKERIYRFPLKELSRGK